MKIKCINSKTFDRYVNLSEERIDKSLEDFIM